jgi:predicted phage baseplate assembly protein
VLKTSVPYIARVENRSAAAGGVQGETVQDAAVRAPMVLRSRDRAVTAEDFEHLAREVARELARVQCLTGEDGQDAHGIRLVVVPHADRDELGRVDLAALRPEDTSTLARITAHLDERRLIGTRLVVQWAGYRGVTAVARLHARPGHRAEDVRTAVLRALYQYLDPVHGGPDGSGWTFGTTLHRQELVGALAAVPGADLGDLTVAMYPADPRTGRRQAAAEKLELGPDELLLSYDHQVRVQ